MMVGKMLISDGSHHSIGLDHGDHLQQEIGNNLVTFWRSIESLGYDRTAVIRAAIRNEALLSEENVERQTTMPLAQNEPITDRTPRVPRLVSENVIVKHTENLHQRESRCHVSAPAGIEDPDDSSPQVERSCIKPGRGIRSITIR